MPLRILIITTFALALATLPAAATPPDADLGAAQNGGGCYPTGIAPGLFDNLGLVDPEWAPVVNGPVVDSTPVYFHGTVETFHGDTGGDFPATHVTSDAVFDIALDPADVDLAGTGNEEPGHLGVEWEHGSMPSFAWPGLGDHVTALGRWIFDCGHPDSTAGACSGSAAPCILDGDCPTGQTCEGEHFNYETELHPPQAIATIRSGRGGVVLRNPAAAPVLATRADILVSGDGGGVGDRCILTHRDPPLSLFGINCFPLSQPVAPINAQDFEFDVPAPPRPGGIHPLRWHVVSHPAPGGRAARVRVRRVPLPTPHVHVIVRMTRRVLGLMPTGYAGTIVVGWGADPTPLTHVRVTMQSIEITNALKPLVPIAPKTCSESGPSCTSDADCTDPARPACLYLGNTSKVCQRPCGADTDCQPPTCPTCGASATCEGVGPVKNWAMQAAVNGEWQRFTGLDDVTSPTNSAEGAFTVPQTLVYDQYLPANGAVRIQAHGISKECVDALLGQSLGTDLAKLGLFRGLDCLTSRGHTAFGGSRSHNPGKIDVTYPGPDFGAGLSGTTDYVVTSAGGDGGQCLLNKSMYCVFDEDCPPGDGCEITGNSYNLHYRIERVP